MEYLMTEEHNYMKKIRKMIEDGVLPANMKNISIFVEHDWDCPALNGKGICTCDPKITIYKGDEHDG